MFDFLKIMFPKDAILHLILCSQGILYLINPQILCLTIIQELRDWFQKIIGGQIPQVFIEISYCIPHFCMFSVL